MSSANSFRRFCATPLLAFDQVRHTMQTSPKPSNYIMMMTSFVAILCLGNGADKFTTMGNISKSYEQYRRSQRFFMPYFIRNYSYRHPQIKM